MIPNISKVLKEERLQLFCKIMISAGLCISVPSPSGSKVIIFKSEEKKKILNCIEHLFYLNYLIVFFKKVKELNMFWQNFESVTLAGLTF